MTKQITIIHELQRVLPQLRAINYTNRTVMREIQEGNDDIDTIHEKLNNLEQLEMVANDILTTLDDAIFKLENASNS